jgi:alpha-tubulin suppressor-like RCC1 family protein
MELNSSDRTTKSK